MSSNDGAKHSPKSSEGTELLTIVTNNKMGMRPTLQGKFKYLTENTKCVDTLVTTLYTFKVLGTEDKSKIKRPGLIDSERMGILYEIVEKSDENWPKLICAWEVTNNVDIIAMMLKVVQKLQNQHNQIKQLEVEPRSGNNLQTVSETLGGQQSNVDEVQRLLPKPNVPAIQQEFSKIQLKKVKSAKKSLKKGITVLAVVLTLVFLTTLLFGVVIYTLCNFLLRRNENYHNITSFENKTVTAVANLTTSEPLQYLAANFTKTELGTTVPKDEKYPHHESFTTKPSKYEFIRFIPLEEMKQNVLEDPQELSKLPDSPNELFIVIAPTKLHNWDVGLFKAENVRAIAFRGYLNPESVISVIKKFRIFLTHIAFFFENNLCDEFYDYSALPGASKVELPVLQEIHFEGDVDCGNVFRFIINEIILRNIRILKFSETNMIYNSASFVRQIFEDSQSTLEYIYFNGVSFCSNCTLFGNLEFPRLKRAEFSFNSGASAPENADAINRFNSDISVNCRSTYPTEKKFRVEC